MLNEANVDEIMFICIYGNSSSPSQTSLIVNKPYHASVHLRGIYRNRLLFCETLKTIFMKRSKVTETFVSIIVFSISGRLILW
jgi:hypothetical protein